VEILEAVNVTADRQKNRGLAFGESRPLELPVVDGAFGSNMVP
jgi:hypothetical protein